MRKFGRLVLFGFLSWLAIFSASICLLSVQRGDTRLFEMLMGLVLTLCTVFFIGLYFRRIRSAFAREGILLGLSFFSCNILFDLPMFMAGPMQMPFLHYLKNIGVAYLSMPVMSIAFGWALQRRCISPVPPATSPCIQP